MAWKIQKSSQTLAVTEKLRFHTITQNSSEKQLKLLSSTIF